MRIEDFVSLNKADYRPDGTILLRRNTAHPFILFLLGMVFLGASAVFFSGLLDHIQSPPPGIFLFMDVIFTAILFMLGIGTMFYKWEIVIDPADDRITRKNGLFFFQFFKKTRISDYDFIGLRDQRADWAGNNLLGQVLGPQGGPSLPEETEKKKKKGKSIALNRYRVRFYGKDISPVEVNYFSSAKLDEAKAFSEKLAQATGLPFHEV